MKKIKVDRFTAGDPDSVYLERKLNSVTLYWDKTYRFSSIKAIKKFLVDVSNELNELAHRLNFLYMDLVVIHRQTVFQIDCSTNKKITDNLNNAAAALDFLISHEFTHDQGFFIIKRLNESSRALWYAAGWLYDEKQRLNEAAAALRLELLIKDILQIEARIKGI